MAVLAAGAVVRADWPEWRGPNRDGTAADAGLPTSWSPEGDNLAWRAPYGGRSAPVVFGDRVYLYTAVGAGDEAQERLVALDANSGAPVWERRFNVFLSDVPAHRAAWASPSVDTETGTIYTLGVGGLMTATTPDGRTLWQRSLVEDFGFVTTHGGRTVSPVVEEDLVVVHGLHVAWGDLGRGGNRWFAFDKRTGETVWVSAPQRRHYDTNMSTPIVTTVDGMKLLIVGGTDGAFHAMKLRTGEPVWSLDVSKRAILNSPVLKGTTAYFTHSEENLGTNEMGMVAAIDIAKRGALDYKQEAAWFEYGYESGFPSPVTDGERLYVIENSALLHAFDLKDGRHLWEHSLGTLQKASPVLADGKLYVGTENGRVFILRPSATGVEVLDEDWLGSRESPEAIFASPAVSGGRVFITSVEATYAIGAGAPKAAPATLVKPQAEPGSGEPAWLQVRPYEVLLKPGEKATFTARLYDGKGRFLREAPAEWTLEGIGGTIAGGTLTAPDSHAAGYVKASAGGLTGQARVRVIAPLPWTFDFEQWEGEAPPAHWINTQNKLFVREADGGRVLVRVPDNTPQRRTRVFMGPSTWSDYTVQADIRVTERRRQMSDAGVFAQRYGLVVFGNNQKIELQPWQAAPGRTVTIPFQWKPDTWYRVKLQVQNEADGVTVARGKVWPRDAEEPADWMVVKRDAIGHREGAPGLYADPANEIYFDNVKVEANR
jgi:outer membrane protein assembly factor BamB